MIALPPHTVNVPSLLQTYSRFNIRGVRMNVTTTVLYQTNMRTAVRVGCNKVVSNQCPPLRNSSVGTPSSVVHTTYFVRSSCERVRHPDKTAPRKTDYRVGKFSAFRFGYTTSWAPKATRMRSRYSRAGLRVFASANSGAQNSPPTSALKAVFKFALNQYLPLGTLEDDACQTVSLTVLFFTKLF
jgi:hypothetical protein